MHPRTVANVILFASAAILSALLVYGLIGLFLSLENAQASSLSNVHKMGLTALALVVSILLVGGCAKLYFHGVGTHLSKRDIEAISNAFSIFYEFRTLFERTESQYCDIERCLNSLCARLDKIYRFPEEKIRKIESLRTLVASDYPGYKDHLDLAIARVGLSVEWLPKSSDTWLNLVATNNDLAYLSEIARNLRSLKHPRAGAAEMRYRQEVVEQLGPKWRADVYIKMSETSKLPKWFPYSPGHSLGVTRASTDEEITLLEIFAKQGGMQATLA